MKRFLAGVALCALTTLPAVAQETEATTPADAATVLARVNGAEITLGHVIAMQALLPDQYRQLPDDVLLQGILDQLVQQQVLAAAAEAAMNRRMALGLANEQRAFLAAALLNEVGAAPVSEEELAAEYEAVYGEAQPTTEYNAAHILVESEDQARGLVEELANGADFTELAQEYSIGPSGPNGGALGWFAAGMMVPEFEAAVMELEPGEISQPVETQFGWHVIILNETREQPVPELEQVRAELEDGLRRARVDARMQELTEAAEIEFSELDIDAALIRNLDLLTE